MIMLSRLNGLPFALNPDLVERAEATPDTVLTLCDGSKLVIGESVEELVTRVRHYRASILSLADQVAVPAPSAPALHVVPLHGREA
jgi:flagellar protein FlbD